MEPKYVCPDCKNSINVGNDIVLIAKNEFGQKGIVALHTVLGNYESKFSDGFSIVEGEHVKFSCPICHSNFTHKKNNRLARFIQIDENKKESYIVFSQIYGEKCTYKIEDKEITESYGEHLNRYSDPEWFMWF